MSEHYGRNTTLVRQYCPTCNAFTPHRVADRKVGSCTNSHAKHHESKSVLTDAAMNREERVAIMTICGNMSEEEAQRYCDTKPDVYGIREKTEIQEALL